MRIFRDDVEGSRVGSDGREAERVMGPGAGIVLKTLCWRLDDGTGTRAGGGILQKTLGWRGGAERSVGSGAGSLLKAPGCTASMLCSGTCRGAACACGRVGVVPGPPHFHSPIGYGVCGNWVLMIDALPRIVEVSGLGGMSTVARESHFGQMN